MLDLFFLQMVNMSYTASFVILFILLARIALRKAPKVFSYALWSVALFRLVCPWSFESGFSLLAVGRSTTEQIAVPPAVQAWTTISSSLPLSTEPDFLLSTAQAPLAEPLLNQLFTSFWLAGIAALFIYSVVSLLRLRRQLKGAVHEGENIYHAAHLSTPFVLGLIRPKIYLPESLSADERTYILRHEQIHIRRFDHVIKVISFFVLCLHWFNPLVWLAFFVSGRDMEMSCDEAVIGQLGNEIKKPYSSSLLSLSTGRSVVSTTPLAFSEGDTRSRIQNVLHYKKPAFWVIAVGLFLVIAVSIGLAANPKTITPPPIDGESLENVEIMNAKGQNTGHGLEGLFASPSQFTGQQEKAISQAILSYYGGSNPLGSSTEPADIICESHVTFAQGSDGPSENNEKPGPVTIYTMVLYQKYRYVDDGLKEVGGSHGPAAITFDIDESGNYILAEYWVPRDGSYYVSDIKEKFPAGSPTDLAMDTQKFILEQKQDCYAQAIAHKNLDTRPIIEKNFEILMSSPQHSSNPGDYIREHELNYRELTYYGDYTLRYVFSEFLSGKQTGIKGHVMSIVMTDLIGSEAIAMGTDNGQTYFDVWLAQGQQKLATIGEEAMRKNYPKAYLLLTMLPDQN